MELLVTAILALWDMDLQRKPTFGNDHSAHDAAYEGGNFFEVADLKGMDMVETTQSPAYHESPPVLGFRRRSHKQPIPCPL